MYRTTRLLVTRPVLHNIYPLLTRHKVEMSKFHKLGRWVVAVVLKVGHNHRKTIGTKNKIEN
jgi:hypothetical protein